MRGGWCAVTATNCSDLAAYHAGMAFIASMSPAAVRRFMRRVRRDLARAGAAVGPMGLPLGIATRVAMEVRL